MKELARKKHSQKRAARFVTWGSATTATFTCLGKFCEPSVCWKGQKKSAQLRVWDLNESKVNEKFGWILWLDYLRRRPRPRAWAERHPKRNHLAVDEAYGPHAAEEHCQFWQALHHRTISRSSRDLLLASSKTLGPDQISIRGRRRKRSKQNGERERSRSRRRGK